LHEPPADQTPASFAVCAIRHTINKGEGEGHGDVIGEIIPIAGDLEEKGGYAFDFETRYRKDSDEPGEEVEKTGFRLELRGGAYRLDGPKEEKKKQIAIIDFVCNEKKTGLENEWTSEDKYEPAGGNLGRREGLHEREEEGKGEEKVGTTKETQLIKEGAALKFVSYGAKSDEPMLEILHLTWETKHACLGADEAPPEEGDEPSHHWGFFTWFVVM
jgi:autophagy-related protein 27